MKQIEIGMSLERAKQFSDELEQQVRAAEAAIVQGQPIDGLICLEVEAQHGERVATGDRRLDLLLSNDNMERSEVRDTVLVQVT